MNFGRSAVKLCAAAQAIGWTPDTFWNSTPADLGNALGLGGDEDEPPDRAQIAALMERFPDAMEQAGNG